MEKPKSDYVERLEIVEGDLLSLVERVRSIRQEVAAASQRNPQLECLLSADDVAKLLGVETAYVYGLARTGKIPSLKFGRYRRFLPANIKGWLNRKGHG
jgi:excisionase family DNA binding protein